MKSHYTASSDIFTGALFVGFYNIPSENHVVIKLLIVLLGLITSFCWHFSVKGYYHWMKSWISVVHTYESKLAEISKELGHQPYYVYNVYINQEKRPFDKNISTQKVTSKFTFWVIMGWNVLLFYTVYICLDAFCSEKFKKVFSPCCMILICIIVIALDFFIVLRMNKLNSDVKTMKADIYGTERK